MATLRAAEPAAAQVAENAPATPKPEGPVPHLPHDLSPWGMFVSADYIVQGVMIGTTHFTNALVEAKHLCRVGVLRLAAPATLAIRPMVDWPETLRDVVLGHTEIIGGGFNYDGRPISPLEPALLKAMSSLPKLLTAVATSVL